MTLSRQAILASIVVIIVLLLSSLYIVNEGQEAILLRLGKIVMQANNRPVVLLPGLHVKMPLVDTVRFFDMRTQQLSSSSQTPLTVVTREQTYLVVDYFARWRINDPVKFYTSTGGLISRAEILLEQRLNDMVRAEYGDHTSNEAISTTRAPMMATIQQQAVNVGKDFGVQVSDVRIEQITLPAGVIDSVFRRMETERHQYAIAKRSQGVAQAKEIRAQADKAVTIIKAQALADAATQRAAGDLAAARLYTAAYNSNRAFYAFYRSLQAYQQSFTNKDQLVLKPDGQFFDYFHGMKGTKS